MGIAHPAGGSRQQSGSRGSGRVIPFGKYLLLERIAVGGMAEVFLAKSFGIEGFEKIIAIKRILPTMVEDEDFIEMFIDEAKIAGHLTHANIVPIYELGKIGESHYIAMEYVWGKDTLQIMNRFRRMRKRPSPAMVAFVASKVCEGLDYAHNKRDRKGNPLNLVHRDVSPQNILVSYEGQIKLIDFGIARAASRTTKTQAGVLKGKFGYMSPEQVRGLPIDYRSDIFAVGTCMYELLTTERLFLGESDFTTLEKVRNADVQPPSKVVDGIPQQLEDIIMKALAREPDQRWQSAGELQEALQRFLASQRPPYGTSKLASWMKMAFPSELDEEKARIDKYASIGRPSVLGQGTHGRRQQQTARPSRNQPPRSGAQAKAALQPERAVDGGRPSHELTEDLRLEPGAYADAAPGEGDDDFEGEATLVSPAPTEEEPQAEGAAEAAPAAAADAASQDDLVSDEPTMIFFSADEMDIVDDAAPAPQGPAPTPSARAAPAPAQPPAGRPSPRSAPPPATPVPPPPAAAAKQAASGGGVPRPASPPQPAGSTAPTQEMGSAAPAQDGYAGASHAEAMRQRVIPTVEMDAVSEEEGAEGLTETRRFGGNARTLIRVALLAVAALLLAGLGAAGAVLLASKPDTGTIQVETVPEVPAAVRIDGEERGTTPLRLAEVPAGERLVEVRADGFESVKRTVHVGPNASAMLHVSLVPASASKGGTGANEADGAEAGAEEEETAKSDEADEPDEGPSGAQAAKDETLGDEGSSAQSDTSGADGEDDGQARASSDSRRGSSTQSGASRQQRPASDRGSSTQSATLVINSMPWARVFIDGRNTGRDTPVRSLRVPPGKRQIGLKTPDGKMHSFTIELSPGETKRFVKQL